MKTTKTIAKIAGVVLAGMMALSFASCNEKNGGSGAVGADGLTKAQAKLLKEKPAPEADFEIALSKDGSYVTVTKYKGKAKTLVIPSTIQGLPVKRVGKGGDYYACVLDKDSSVTSLVISEGIEVVASEAFWLDDYDDYGNLQTVVLPSTLKAIGQHAFAENKTLTAINLPDGLEVIDGGAFWATGITSLTLPKSLQLLGWDAFEYCDNLAEINIPDGLSLINSTYGSDVVDLSKFISGAKINESVALQQKLRSVKSKEDGKEYEKICKKYRLR